MLENKVAFAWVLLAMGCRTGQAQASEPRPHNVRRAARTVYSPPNPIDGRVRLTKADAEAFGKNVR